MDLSGLASAVTTVDQATVVVFTFGNMGYSSMICNQAKSILAAGCEWKLVVLCLDQQLYRYLSPATNPVVTGFVAPANVVAIDFSSQVEPISSNIERYGEVNFKRIVFEKIKAIEFMLRWGKDKISHIFYMDGDVVILKDPLPYLVSYLATAVGPPTVGTRPVGPATVDILFQCDQGGDHNDPLNLVCSCNHQQHCGNYCSGVVFAAVNSNAAELFHYDEQLRQLGASMIGNCEDQAVLNDRIKAQPKRWALSALNRRLFPNGWLQRYHSHLATEIYRDSYLVHYNYLYHQDKVPAMKSNGHWWVTE